MLLKVRKREVTNLKFDLENLANVGKKLSRRWSKVEQLVIKKFKLLLIFEQEEYLFENNFFDLFSLIEYVLENDDYFFEVILEYKDGDFKLVVENVLLEDLIIEEKNVGINMEFKESIVLVVVRIE